MSRFFKDNETVAADPSWAFISPFLKTYLLLIGTVISCRNCISTLGMQWRMFIRLFESVHSNLHVSQQQDFSVCIWKQEGQGKDLTLSCRDTSLLFKIAELEVLHFCTSSSAANAVSTHSPHKKRNRTRRTDWDQHSLMRSCYRKQNKQTFRHCDYLQSNIYITELL